MSTTEVPQRRVFRPRLVPTLFAVLAVGVTGSLGSWQLNRYLEKVEQVELYHHQHDELPPVTTLGEAKDDVDRTRKLHFRQVTVTGTLVLAEARLLTGRYMFGKMGFDLVVPLSVEGGKYPTILVDLGWVAADNVEGWLKELRAHPGPRQIAGRLQVADAPDPEEKPVSVKFGLPAWIHPNPAALAKQVSGLEPQLMIQAGKQASGETVDVNKIPLDGYAYPIRMPPQKHIEYVITWWGVALTAIAVWIAFSREPLRD